MTYPAGLTTITVRHKVVSASGRPLKGNSVTAVPAARVYGMDGSIVEYEASTKIAADGTWELDLPQVDQAAIRNKGVHWLITEHIPGERAPKPHKVAPTLAHGAGPVDLAEVLVSEVTSKEVTIQAGPVTDEAAAGLLDQGGQFATRLSTTIATETAEIRWARRALTTQDTADALTTQGVYWVGSGAVATALGLPVIRIGTLEVLPAPAASTSQGTVQRFTTNGYGGPGAELEIWTRATSAAGAWQSWKKVYPAPWSTRALTAADNLDNLDTLGVYRVPNPTIATTLAFPVARVGTLEVLPANETGLMQRYTTNQPSDTAPMEIWVRQKPTSSGAWQPWQKTHPVTVPTPPAPTPLPTTTGAPRITHVATTMQPGHGFTVLGGAANAESLTDDPAECVRGVQSLALRPRIAVATASSIQRTDLPAFDATDAALVVTFRLDDHTRTSKLIVYAASNTAFTSYFQWSIHGATESQRWAKSGEWVTLTLPFANAAVVGTPNRAALRLVRLRAASPAGEDITVRFNMVGTTPQPAARAVVSLAIDDIYTSTWTQMRPVLDKYGYGATIYAIPSRAGLVGIDRLRHMENASGWEVAGHGLTGFLTGGMTLTEIEADLIASKQWLINNGFRGVDHYAYAGGQYSPEIEQLTRRHYKSARTIVADGSMRVETLPPANPYRLRSLSVAHTTPPATVTGIIDRVAEHGGWFILTLHDITAGEATQSTQYSAANLNTILAHLAGKNITVKTVGDVLAGV